MGFGDITTQMIMFIAVLSASAVLISTFNDQMVQTSGTVLTKQNQLTQQLITDINIETIGYNTSNDQLTFYIKNTGSSKMRLQRLGIYVDNVWIQNDSNRDLYILSDTDTINPGTWDGSEVVKGVINITLDTSETHTLRITTQYETNEEEEFSI